jgi:WD40 repeat protein
MLMPRWRSDGHLILTNNGWLMVFEPEEARVIERVPVALASLSSDVCSVDGSVVVTDLTGRLRVFELDDSGHYRFAWGISLFAPRRASFSPDCSRIGVTSADDHHVYMVDAAERRVVDVFNAGPALREIAATGPREFSISDVCTMTTFRW